MEAHGIRCGRIIVAAVLALLITAALALVACGGSGTTASSAPSPASSVPSLTDVMGGTSPSAIPLPAPTVAGTIAFVQVKDNGGQGWGDIYQVGTDGAGLTPLAAGADSEEEPAWSPDGNKIAYTAGKIESGASFAMRVMNADGSDDMPLTRGAVFGICPSWSRDGTRVAFSRYSDATSFDVAIVNADGSGLRTVTDRQGDERFPTWFSDRKLLFLNMGKDLTGADTWNVSSVNVDGSNPARVTPGGVAYYALSPDGKRLLLHDAKDDRLVLLPVSGKGTPVVVVEGVSRYVPEPPAALAWSPDGKSIAFASSLLYNPAEGSGLYVVNADGTGLSAIPGISSAAEPSWRPQ